MPAAPAPYGAPEVYDAAPEAFAYQYGVADDYTSTNFKKSENQDEYGTFKFKQKLEEKMKIVLMEDHVVTLVKTSNRSILDV